ncbi:MAG: amino acid decarboxylase [Rhodobacter sp.]|uniref:pyridoxal phosphate-dependent decarboxylase family protein n=1 Tax=Pararhodobacter sp. TaxID=2127056 RepID=UPI001D6DA6DF|nr:pyridoxal-dependent decarboxylase [Pararhodobacter sp.]MCB1344088.1 amino acid decarboxylase [Paracoccaceae bacterium]MCC0071650.1 amino acid decarboxylase [Rhodobacter sp.]HPD93465.1 pyridoxal-dependent decarboxylase [Pararhodobacter sp.]
MADTLDPADWDAYRRAAHALLDACMDRLETARAHPWKPLPETVRAGYALDGVARGEVALARELTEQVLPWGTGNTHPRFWGWVHGTGLASGVMAEMVAATMNANLGGRAHGAIEIERAVIDWTRQVMGFPDTGSGVLVTGTSQATVIALAAARGRAQPEVRSRGVAPGLVAYAGAGAHNAARKAMELLGLGHQALRAIPETDAGMDLDALRVALARDRAAGLCPFAVIGTAGSVDLGRFDDLNALADLAAEQGLWLHVDGAFGAWTRLADTPWRALSDGIGRADSVACDFHKWMFVPYDCGLVLIRDEAAHRAAFAARPAYLAGQSAGLGGGDPWFCDYGIDLSRGNRALKAWAAIRAHGADGLGAAITRCCALAARMGQGVEARAPMRLAAPVVSNLCVFTADARLPAADQSARNTHIAQALQLSGEAVFSTTVIGGVTCLRAAITNHRTTPQDIDAALDAVTNA